MAKPIKIEFLAPIINCPKTSRPPSSAPKMNLVPFIVTVPGSAYLSKILTCITALWSNTNEPIKTANKIMTKRIKENIAIFSLTNSRAIIRKPIGGILSCKTSSLFSSVNSIFITLSSCFFY